MKKTVRIKSLPIEYTFDGYKIYPPYVAVDLFRKLCNASDINVTLEVIKCKQETGKIHLHGEEADIMKIITAMVSAYGRYFEVH